MKKYLINTALLGALAFTTLAPNLSYAQSAENATATTQSKLDNQTIDDLKSEAKEMTARERMLADKITEAFDSINQAQEAILAKDKVKADENLVKALGQLEAVVSLNPDLLFIPLNKEYITTDTYHNVDDLLAARRVALGFLRRGHVQDARLILADMVSELNIRTTNLPLVGYVDAIRVVLPLVNDDNFDGAKEVLDTALLTRVVSDKIVPLPIIRMVTALEAAQAIELDDEKSADAKKQEVLEHLDYAEEQMKLAVAYGYADKDTYKQSRKTIKSLRKNIINAIDNADTYTKALSDVKTANDKLESAQKRADDRQAAKDKKAAEEKSDK